VSAEKEREASEGALRGVPVSNHREDEETMSEKQIFRKEAIKSISTPDELDDYLHVTNTSVWMVLGVVIVLLLGLFAWATVGELETTVEVSAQVEQGKAFVYAVGRSTAEMKEGMLLRVDGQETQIEQVGRSESGWPIGTAHISLEDGSYSGVIVIESTKPIDFLLESR